MQGEDPVYAEFWKRYGGTTTEYVDHDDLHPFPWLRPVHDLITEPEFFMQEAEVSADSGLVDRIRDANGEYTTRRVCPHCHNPLPEGYGRYPVKHIGVVGLPGSGKTVYLSQFCGLVEAEFKKIGIRAVPLAPGATGYRRNTMISALTPVPEPTKPESLQQPLCFELTYTGKSGKQYGLTLVFHDVSGRNCEVSRDSPSLSDNAARYAPFLEHADALMLMVDPTQLDAMGAANTSEGPQSVLSVLRDLYAGRAKQLERMPLAVCLTKGDAVANQIFGGPMREMTVPAGGAGQSRVFNAEDYNRIHGALVKFVQDKSPTLDNALSVQYPNYNLFIVSALGTGTRPVGTQSGTRNVPAGALAPKRLIEPVLWILHRMGFVGSAGLAAMPNEWICPGCERSVPGDVGYCPNCGIGRDGDWKCLLCGTVNSGDDQRCRHVEQGLFGRSKRCNGMCPFKFRETPGANENFTGEIELIRWAIDDDEREAAARKGDLEAQLAIFDDAQKDNEGGRIRYWGDQILKNPAIKDRPLDLCRVCEALWNIGSGVERFQWAVLASRSGDRSAGVAQYQLGQLYLQGKDGVPKNLERGRYWLERAWLNCQILARDMMLSKSQLSDMHLQWDIDRYTNAVSPSKDLVESEIRELDVLVDFYQGTDRQTVLVKSRARLRYQLQRIHAREQAAIEAARRAEEARRAEAARKAEEARRAEEARQAEKAKRFEEARKAQAARRAKEAEAARKAEEAKRAEAAKQEEAERKALAGDLDAQIDLILTAGENEDRDRMLFWCNRAVANPDIIYNDDCKGMVCMTFAANAESRSKAYRWLVLAANCDDGFFIGQARCMLGQTYLSWQGLADRARYWFEEAQHALASEDVSNESVGELLSEIRKGLAECAGAASDMKAVLRAKIRELDILIDSPWYASSRGSLKTKRDVLASRLEQSPETGDAPRTASKSRPKHADASSSTPSFPPAVSSFCTHCGSQLAPGAKFCFSCGSPVQETSMNDWPSPVSSQQGNNTHQRQARPMTDEQEIARADMLVAQVEGLRQEKRYQEAEPLAREAYELRQFNYGLANKDTLSALHLLIYVLNDLHRYREAVELCRILVDIRSMIYAPDAPELKDAKDWLAFLSQRAG
ncbi:SEL1-like repeat protein [Bifidobacterium callimiconis]|nr:SEL1-like repeat protein [Bifidobacterium callimiconis]